MRVSSEKLLMLDATVNTNTLEGVDVVAHIKPVVDKTLWILRKFLKKNFTYGC